MRKLLVGMTLMLILLTLNVIIYQKEKHLSDANSVFLKLAPVDPRSLMQGDYMALRFEVANQIYATLPKKGSRWFHRRSIKGSDGKVIVNLDEQNVATFHSIYAGQKLEAKQTLLQYRIRAGKVKFASNAFFFQEGRAKAYEKARYAEFKVNDSHELLLADMYDANLNKIVANTLEVKDETL